MQLRSNIGDQDHRFARAFRLLTDAIAARAFPGCSVAVIHRGELVACKALGRFTYEPQSPAATADTCFDTASLTKILATTPVAMILYERGLLDLDMPVESILREFAGEGGDPRRREVTIRSLLAHTSGLPAYIRLFESARTRDELVRAACSTQLESAPGERTEYSDIGFIVLGEALARVADEALDSFSRREVFGPLGMTSTTFNPPAEWRPRIPPTEEDRSFRHRIVQGEVHDENASAMGGLSGHAGLFSNAPDIAKFAQAMLNGRPPIVRAETLRTFATPQPSHSGKPRALGFDLPSPPSQSGRYFSPQSLGHLGFTGTSLWMDLRHEVAVVLLTNRTWPDRSSQAIKQVRPAVHDAIFEALGAADAETP